MFVRALLIAIVCLTSLGACDKPSHENVEKWANTQKGTGKLESAFKDENLDPDLSAHAGAVLIKKGLDPDVRSALEQMSPSRKTAVVAKLAPRLWELARIEGDLQLPNPTQVRAKDALARVRKSADDASKKQTDGYLVDRHCVGSYEARATSGAIQGAAVIRLLGSAAAKKLLHVAEGILALNAGNATKKNRLGDELLLGLAVTARKCGGLPAAKDVVKALPDGPYRQDELVGGVVVDITLMSPRAQVLQTFRDLLTEKGRIPRWVAIEGLAAMKSTEDIPRLQAVNSGEKLVGYWGDQSGVDAKDRKPEPTLGQLAKELAARLG